ncbi:ER-golgi trafficking TRAPP I complex 85 kDa subunit-domain-containing protein [Rhodocollybia butyracea]|uniref:ER-golgi trafficking TRAPP I complex 85 kDa subunit-domain-containing protein n=1 Tax=Rhodocollybia butyracea TaxID=206335 RepID=A0A9P5UDD8_9AGAR|nr:ER-golgi trafficking TRAPP I complex 85 kDa subunit-domain-containing protein [Rhodocollybia butyracea]
MAPPLPSSLSPHICILSSPDLKELLTASSLPQLPEILQSFSPLPQVNTRTTSLTSIPHKAFSLRFSDLIEIEASCLEDEEQRAVRTVDWIGSRIGARCAQWVEDIEKMAGKQSVRLPWWDELKRCVEGDHVPSKAETWNHPAAIILAVSTNTPNPLQAISNLHSRAIELPSWVDPVYLRYTLIVHPKESALSDEESSALFNAVKKQYGLHSYLLPLDMPNPPPAPVPVPTPKPRLPLAGSDSMEASLVTNTLRMNEKDIQQTAKFTREFLVMSLIPWMEKCVLDWNESFVSTRRLPSRLFSSTRRLFGTPSPSPTPPPNHRSTPSRASTYTAPATTTAAAAAATQAAPGGLPQQRRLAEFATILGDFKLAVTVWEALSKEGKGGSDILPLLLSPSPAIPLHVSNALNAMFTQSTAPMAQMQLRALLCAIRWEIGIDPSDFASEMLGGERWLVWAAGSAEEPPSALLLAHAAFISSKKQAFRRAGFWYLLAANRLEKCGIKPLTMYFLRKAHDLYRNRPKKELSPSFWDAEGKQFSDSHEFDAIIPGIQHPLGRLLYTTGNVKEAVEIFLSLLKGSASSISTSAIGNGGYETETDEVYLEDFRVAFEHLKTNLTNLEQLKDITIPFSFCVPRQTQLRFLNNDDGGEFSGWDKCEEAWSRFSRSHGLNSHLATESKAYVNEPFWIDLALKNPLDVDVTLTDLTVTVQESNENDPSSSKSFLDVEIVKSVSIGPRETRTIPISVKATRPTALTITHITYTFLSLLPSIESLAVRGQRLHSTAVQRQTPTYAPDIVMKVAVAEAGCRLLANFSEDKQLVLNQGEVISTKLWLSNTGVEPIAEVWLVVGSDNLWLNKDEAVPSDLPTSETIHSSNSLKPQEPFSISLGSSSLMPGQSLEVPVTLHALDLGPREIRYLLLYRENKDAPFKQVRKVRSCQVLPLFRIAIFATPSSKIEEMFLVDLELQNNCTSAVQITRISTISPRWTCNSLVDGTSGPVFPSQSSRFVLGVNPWVNPSGCEETLDYVVRQLEDVVRGRAIGSSEPPPLDLCCSHVFQTQQSDDFEIQSFIHSGKRHTATESLVSIYPHIPPHTHHHIFPLFNPAALDILVFWEIPSENRKGNQLVSALHLGATHSPLQEIIEGAENAKSTRSMYAQTRREKEEVLQAIRNSEWNMEMNPLYVFVRTASGFNHDFTKGPCCVRVNFTVRNFSTTMKSRFILKLNGDASDSSSSSTIQPVVYCGRLTFRGTLEQTMHTTFSVTAWVGRPGTYALGAWQIETEVLEGVPKEQVRHRYLQQASLDDNPFINVCHVDS